jgi:hypothetical protein
MTFIYLTRENIDVSKDGLKASLLTFISGHATSIIILAFLILAYYMPVFCIPLNKFKHFDLSVESKVFVSVIILFLLYPFGLFMDVLGWLLLGWMEKWFETIHFRYKSFLTIGTKNYLCFEYVKDELKLTKNNFYETARQSEYYLITKHPDVISELDFSLGSSILFRNLTICAIIVSVIYFFICHFWLGIIALIAALLFITINSCVSFYYSLSILMFYIKLTKVDLKT